LKTDRPNASVLGLGLQDASIPSEFSPLPRGRATRPPVFLLTENQASWSARKEAVEPTNTKAITIPSSPALPLPLLDHAASSAILRNESGLLTRAFNWIRTRQLGRSNTRRLQVAATVSLGEKRFVAVIQIDGLQFLIGGGASNIALLAQLDGKGAFGHLLKESMAVPQLEIAELAAEQTGAHA
jgi:hypothetical protein